VTGHDARHPAEFERNARPIKGLPDAASLLNVYSWGW